MEYQGNMYRSTWMNFVTDSTGGSGKSKSLIDY